MNPISQIQPSFLFKKGANSERAEITEQVCNFMDGDTKRFVYWLGRTKKLNPERIYQIIRGAKEGRNPQALFNFLLKKELSTVDVD